VFPAKRTLAVVVYRFRARQVSRQTLIAAGAWSAGAATALAGAGTRRTVPPAHRDHEPRQESIWPGALTLRAA